ncbi:Fpg/Nei family DNA glycosylase [Thiohalobacter thiocyanaticus]|uniref:Fpg/Nei family DNA glycosylase n=1 Tax=Thiohalobacter thiocyanaticus TaxID=585455 RepID=A0A426QGW7_9GAMM|nr:DNA-formamidopyrimidine glycosylase family protein [Thiohalobacter thiocyanaticus]RRQ20992.1 Fpg/Nei family DNA glycosylase [Thiohalobacter thiocyanaticus]
MPELPDVETERRYLAATALHRRITRVHADQDLLEGTTPAAMGRVLHDRRFETTHRHGKFLFAASDGPWWLVLHFGMTGGLVFFKAGGAVSPPRHIRLLFEFDNDYRLAYDCQRKLGLIALCRDPATFVSDRGLGPDALDSRLDLDAFEEARVGRRLPVKAWLMDQQAIAGIGNVYSDEILFHARIHPACRINALDPETVQRLFQLMKKILEQCVKARAEPDRMPVSFLLPHRTPDGCCPRCGVALARQRISGRMAYFCPQCQAESGD